MLSKVNKGDDINISASDWNAFVDAANANKVNRPTGRPRAVNLPDPTYVTIKNNTGEPVEQYLALRLTQPITIPSQDEDAFRFDPVALSADYPLEDKPWCVVQEGLDDQEYGYAVVCGVTKAWIDLTDVSHEYCDVISDDPIPTSKGVGPARILWVEGEVGTATDTGEQWAIIIIGASGAAESLGEFQGQQKTMISANQSGWSFNRLHGLLNNS